MDQASQQRNEGAKFTSLILEDDPICGEVLSGIIRREGGKAVVCTSIASATATLDKHHFDLVLLDYQLPDGNGDSFFHKMRQRGCMAPTVMLTAYPHIRVAVELTREGLCDYLTKPFEIEEITSRIRQFVRPESPPVFAGESLAFVARSPAMKKVLRLIDQAAANSRATVLLTGETGTGKDLVARIIHERTFHDASQKPPFILVSCPTLPAEMFEGELFGAEKGSYTGAYKQRVGLIEAAEKGTLFLDEISEVPLPLQSKLLQFVESRTYRRLGSTQTRDFYGRIVAATNRSLDEEVKRGRFREDLLYRLDVFAVSLPPLRERTEDLGGLIDLLLEQLAHKYHRNKPLAKPADIAALEKYDFPGNVRELRNLVERSLLQTAPEDNWLQIDPAWTAHTKSKAAPDEPATPTPSMAGLTLVEQQEFELIRKALEAEDGVIRRAAAKLGLSHQALLRRLSKWPELRRYCRGQADEA